MSFIPRNDSFNCESCGQTVPPAQGTCRNHCPSCFTSKHVDATVPGDRAATCHGLMPTISYEGSDPYTLKLTQKCRRCGLTKRNRSAADDDWEKLLSSLK